MVTYFYKCYLIAIYDRASKEIVGVELWSSPEWEQSQHLDLPTFVAYVVKNPRSYAEAREDMLSRISGSGQYSQPYVDRYGWLYEIYQKTHEVVP